MYFVTNLSVFCNYEFSGLIYTFSNCSNRVSTSYLYVIKN